MVEARFVPADVRVDGRLDWLDRARQLDVALRGVRPPPGLDPVGAQILERHDEARHDEARQSLRPARAGHDAQQDLRQAELGVVSRDAQVAAQGQLQATAEGISGDRGDGRLRDLGDRGERSGQRSGPFHGRGVIPLDHLLDVGTGGEYLRAAVHDDRAHIAPLRRLGRDATQTCLHHGVQYVHGRATEQDRRNSV